MLGVAIITTSSVGAEEKKIFYLMPAEMRCCPLLLIAHFLGACHPRVRRPFKNTPTYQPSFFSYQKYHPQKDYVAASSYSKTLETEII